MPRRPDKPNANLTALGLIERELALKAEGQVMVGCWPPEGHPEWPNRVNHRRFPTDDPRSRHVAGALDPKGGGCWHMLRNPCPCPCHAE